MDAKTADFIEGMSGARIGGPSAHRGRIFSLLLVSEDCCSLDDLAGELGVSNGAGAESWRPLGVAVVGGLLFSQLITLYITPVVYTYLDAWQKRLARRKATEPRQYAEPGTGEAAAQAAG